MNPTDAEIAGMKEELSQAVYLIGKYLNETPLGNQPHMIAGIAEQWLEQRRKRALVVRVDGDVKTPESCGEYLNLSEKEKLQLMKQETSK